MATEARAARARGQEVEAQVEIPLRGGECTGGGLLTAG